ncbi:Na(+)/H(+) antiporter subunit C [Actinomadura montaniterrae]|uniref:Na(+)/H(+) antiporter subunit C n=1 Tax=Actinomadura montaniterrae TaxID=1803903 RepID=A0A6L3VNW5_9ACTN|nr:Na(+)/H(+) antiporter subunit C [Actinomadura montaniterrae]KAB2370677.1 Na(+)/H(+) antiporter subunit C [Actinomadura montaniterrae]
MGPSLVLAATGGTLVAAGVVLLLERSLSRLVVGVLVLSNGVNLLILTAGGPAGTAPILPSRGGPHRALSDPLPQAMILTAIVISLASAAFVLAIAYRGGRLSGDDDVRDDIEDLRVRRESEDDVGLRAERERRAVADPSELGAREEPDSDFPGGVPRDGRRGNGRRRDGRPRGGGRRDGQ